MTKVKSPSLRIVALLTTGEKAFIGLAAAIRLVLVLFDLVGVVLVGVAMAIASGTSTSSSSATGMLLGIVSKLGLPNGYAVIAAISIFFFLVKAVASVLLNRYLALYIAKIEARKAGQVFRSLLHSDLDNVEKWSHEEINFGLMGSFQMAFGMVISTSSAILGELALIASISAFLAYSNLLAFVSLALYFGLIGFAMHFFLNSKSGKVAEINTQAQLDSSTTVNDSLRNFRQFRTSGAVREFSAKFSTSRELVSRSNAEQVTISMMPRYIMEVALMLGLGLLVVQLSLNKSGPVTPAIIAVFVAGAFRIVSSMLPLQGYFAVLKQMDKNSRLALELSELFLMQSEPESVPSKSRLSSDQIVFEGVTYSYASRRKPAVCDLTLTIKRGDFVAIKGKSGAGKSTFADLLLGLRKPNKGEITIFGEQASVYVSQHPGNVAYVSQQTPLFTGTLIQNIVMSFDAADVDREKLRIAIASSDLESVIADLPLGLETPMTANRGGLSGGQIQRVGLARALYLDSEIVILDEATSALDKETESVISDNLVKLMGKVTLIVIAHRLETLEKADRIIRFENGRAVIELG